MKSCKRRTMTLAARAALAFVMAYSASAWGQANERLPHIGYIYPAGGKQASVFQISVGGQFLRGINNVYVTGDGVHGEIVGYVEAHRPLNRQERQMIEKRLSDLRGGKDISNEEDNEKKQQTNPLVRNLDKLTIPALEFIVKQPLISRKLQTNTQIGETVLIKITVDAGAAVGDRELRLGTPVGLTNPLCFQIGNLPEIGESEPNGSALPRMQGKLNRAQRAEALQNAAFTGISPVVTSDAQRVNLPVVLNGQIMPGQVDRFRFNARQGQKLVIQVRARKLVPYLADAVPGWFQAEVTLYDIKGNEIISADHYNFDPDPVLFCIIPRDTEYELDIRDSLYRGREDFVYRVTVGEQPFITRMFPLGGQIGTNTVASIGGWNLPTTKLRLDTQSGTEGIRQTALQQNKWKSNNIVYAADTLPECNEVETNDTVKDAQQITLPCIINGRIAKADDVDVFRFDAKAGDKIVAEVYARRLNSPLDSLLRLTDASGKVLAMNDDNEDKETGLLTHHADSYISFTLSAAGTYYVHLSDSQHHGGLEYGYRLRISAPQPDFALRVTPSSIGASAGRTAAISVHALRKDGFDGDIEVVLKDATKGFALGGAKIPAGRDHVNMTLTMPREPLDEPVTLHFEGIARIGNLKIVRAAVPAEDMMQAFAYRHLVPSQEFMVTIVAGKPWMPSFQLADKDVVRIPAGGTAEVPIKVWKRPMVQNIKLELADPPKGISLKDVTTDSDKMTLVLKADANAVAGFRDNLLVEASADMGGNRQGNNKQTAKQRVFLGAVPAIPIEIVQQ